MPSEKFFPKTFNLNVRPRATRPEWASQKLPPYNNKRLSSPWTLPVPGPPVSSSVLSMVICT